MLHSGEFSGNLVHNLNFFLLFKILFQKEGNSQNRAGMMNFSTFVWQFFFSSKILHDCDMPTIETNKSETMSNVANEMHLYYS